MTLNYQKYFVIGFNKTGTATCDELFKKNGLKSYHAGIKWKTEKWQDQLEKNDCFADIAWTMNDIENVNEKYPNSIFILNCRNIDKWLISRFKHGIRGFKRTGEHAYYPYTYEKIKKWTYYRDSFHINILDFFLSSPDKLIIVNIEKPKWIEYLCSQLQFKNYDIKSKNINKTDINNKQHNEIICLVNETLNDLNYDKDTVLISDYRLLEKYINIYKNYI